MSTITSVPPKSPVAQPSPASSPNASGDQRIAIRGLSWELYDALSDAIGDRQHVYMAYDGKDLEIMVKGPAHEDFKDLFGQLVHAIAHDLNVPRRGLGETTWKRTALERGLEADQCYVLRPEKLEMLAQARARKSNDVSDYPNPDLAIEIDLSPSEIDRLSIYQALEVSEVWRFDGESVVIEQLGPDGTYSPAESSQFLSIKAEEVERWVVEEDSKDLTAWRDRLRAWNQTVLAPRRQK
jgi:Uma2 family endonuclease